MATQCHSVVAWAWNVSWYLTDKNWNYSEVATGQGDTGKEGKGKFRLPGSSQA